MPSKRLRSHPLPGPVTKREIFGWAMFDFANSSYTTVVVTVVYSVFFTTTIIPAESTLQNTYWSLSMVLAMALALVLSPFAGAVCDRSGRKKRYLVVSAVVCSLTTAALALVRPGAVGAGILLVSASYTAFLLGECFCASFLTDLATRKTMGKISGIGWALGYLGGLASLVVVGLIVTADPSEGARRVAQNRAAMAATGAFFLLAALPTFVLVKNRSRPAPGFEKASLSRLLGVGLSEVRKSWILARRHPILFRFLVAFTIYMAGLYVVVAFVAIYAKRELGLGEGRIRIIFLAVQLSAAAGALAFGLLESRLGPKRTILITLGCWVAAVLAIYRLEPLARLLGVEPGTAFFGVALVAGSAIGSTQSSSRAMVGLLAPASRSAQMFGFWGMSSRAAYLLAMAYGPLTDALGSMRQGLLLVLVFFVGGGVLLARIPIDEGIRQAAGRDERKSGAGS